MDKTKDDAFSTFLEKIQGQNKAGLLINTLQLKYERETAGEDADKREEQLEQVATALENVEKAITGMSVKFDFKPVINAIENQIQVLQKSLEEQALLRKVSEGSLEYDKESTQYRNVSGKELTSDVSGKTIKQGGYVDFETAANRLQGQGKRVRESEQNQINFKPVELGKKTTVTDQPGGITPKREKDEETTGFGNIGDLGKAIGARLKGIYDFMTNKVDKKEDVDAKPEITGINPESDNIQSTQEVMAESAKKDVELTGINNDLLEQQLKELKKISAALAPSAPSDLPEGSLKAGPGVAAGGSGGGDGGDGGGGGLGLGDALSGMGGLAKKAGGAIVKGAKVVGKGALSLGGGIAKFAGSSAGKLLGATAAVGLGAYTAYKGYTAAEDSKQSKLDEVQAKVDSGEMKPEEAATARKEIGNTATVEKSGAVGEGSGMAAGAIAGGMAGAKLGATVGTFFGPGIGTAIGAGVGTIAGGALGAFAGSSAGKYVGEKVGSGINAVKGFFGGKADAPGAATKAALAAPPPTVKEPEALSANQKLAQQNVARAKEKAALVAPTGDGSGTLQSGKLSGKAERLSGIKKEFQESEAREAAAKEKIKEFEKANPFDVKPKGDIESGITPGKFNDLKKQEEYNKLQKEQEAQQSQSFKIKSKYKEADVGKDVKPMSAAKAAQENKQAEEANKAGRHPKGKPWKTDYKEGDEAGLNEFEARKKYVAALKEKGVAAEDIDPYRPEDQYNEQLYKELREKDVTGGPGAKIPVVEKKPVDAAAPGDATAAALAPGMAKGGPVEDGADYIVGEKGPELFMPFKDGVVIPNDVSKKITGGKIPLAKGGIALADSKVKVPPIPKLPAQDGELGRGEKVFTNPDGTRTYTGGFGRFTFDKSGKAIKYTSPQFSGLGREIDLTSGNQTTSYNAGPLSTTQTTDAKGNVVSNNTEYDVGLGKMAVGRDAKGITTKSWQGRGEGSEDLVSNKDLYAAGNKDKEATYERAMAQVNVAPAKTTPVGSEVARESVENSDLTRETNMRQTAVQPIISSSVNNNNTQSYVPIKPSPRSPSTGSALDRYNDRVSAY